MKKNKFTAITFIREDSKRLPRKSVLKFGKKLLFEHSLMAYSNSNLIDDVVVYSSSEIVQKTLQGYSKKLKIRFLQRDIEFDKDVSFNTIMESAIDKLDTDYIVYFCVTSPFVKTQTIDEIITKINDEGYDSGFTCHPINNFCWYNKQTLNYSLAKDIPFTQDLEPVLVETSALYIFKKKLFKKENRRIGYKPYIKQVNKIEGIDIDYPQDLEMARYFLEKKQYEKSILRK
jgi:CMP-N-acetylneuraminic acid synthetase